MGGLCWCIGAQIRDTLFIAVEMITERMSFAVSLCSYRCLLFPTQVAQGALLGALIYPPQNPVLCSLQGAPCQAQRMFLHDSRPVTHKTSDGTFRPARFLFARMTRSALSGGSTRAERARSHRCTVRSG